MVRMKKKTSPRKPRNPALLRTRAWLAARMVRPRLARRRMIIAPNVSSKSTSSRAARDRNGSSRSV